MFARLSKKIIVIVAVFIVIIGGLAYFLSGTGTETQPPVVRPLETPISVLETDGSAFMDEEGKKINPFCDRTCKDWVIGSCTFEKQYLERSCTCVGSEKLFYETRLEPSACDGN